MALEQWEEEAARAYNELDRQQRELPNRFYKRTEPLNHENYNRAIAHAMRDAGLWPEPAATMVGAQEYEEAMLAVEIFDEVRGEP